MDQVNYNKLELINAGIADAGHTKLGCEALILYGDGFCELHILSSGYLAGEHYIMINRTVVSTCEYSVIAPVISKFISTSNADRIKIDRVNLNNWGDFGALRGKPIDLLSHETGARSLSFQEGGNAVEFTISGTRIVVSIKNMAGNCIRLNHSPEAL